nr:hypothetical protein [Micromonospora sp. DSM 115978]
MALLADGTCLQRNAWICGEYVDTRSDEILAALGHHVTLTASAVAIGTLFSVPLVVIARRWRFTASWIGSATSILYTVPSLAFFAVLLPFT